MRIAFFTDSTAHGGGGRVCSLLSQIWTRQGHDVRLFAENDPHEGEYSFDCVARETVHQPKLTPEAIKALHAKYGFEVAVIIGRVYGQGLEVMLPCMKELGVRTVGMLHHSFTTWLYFTVIANEYKCKANLELMDCLVCVDPLQTIWWHEMGAKALYIPNPVETGVVEHSGYPARSGNKLVWSGRAKDWGKRLDLMMRMFAKVRESHPDTELTILGDAPQAVQRRYEKEYGRDFAAHVKYAGFVTNVQEYLRQSDIHVFTSILEVTVPQTILEAQVAELPSVVMDMPCFCDIGEKDGVLRCESEEAFAGAVCRLLDDASSCRALGKAAHDSARQRMKSNQTEVEWEGLFASIVEDGARDGFIAVRYAEIDTPAHHSALLHEIQRAFAFFCEKHFPKLKKPPTLRFRVSRFVREHFAENRLLKAFYKWRDERKRQL